MHGARGYAAVSNARRRAEQLQAGAASMDGDGGGRSTTAVSTPAAAARMASVVLTVTSGLINRGSSSCSLVVTFFRHNFAENGLQDLKMV
jgi:hypothetical protein